MDDDAALFDLARGTALNGLERVAHLLSVVEKEDQPDDLLGQALAPGMFNLADQLQIAAGFAERCVMPLLGRAVPDQDVAGSVDALTAHVAEVRVSLHAVTRADFDGANARRIVHQAGDATLDQSPRDYVVDFAVPNMWFHLTMAYAILRAAGLAVGKADFDGLHAYEPGFSFV